MPKAPDGVIIRRFSVNEDERSLIDMGVGPAINEEGRWFVERVRQLGGKVVGGGANFELGPIPEPIADLSGLVDGDSHTAAMPAEQQVPSYTVIASVPQQGRSLHILSDR